MKKLKNYIGQLRLYSLADLILLLVALGTGKYQFIGAVVLHIAFLSYLENKHAHLYRAKISSWISYVLAVVGALFYRRIEGLFYLLFGFLYTKKNKKFGFLSPFYRGLQNLFIVGGIVGYSSGLIWIVGVLFVLRNLAGDFRDIEKDKIEETQTIPILLGFNKSIKYIHLILTIITSIVWWLISPISILWLLLVIAIQVSTYNLTPR